MLQKCFHGVPYRFSDFSLFMLLVNQMPIYLMRVNQIHNRFRTQVLRGDLDVCEKRNVIFSHLSSQTPRILSPFSGPHIKNPSSGTSLVGQGVRLRAPSAEGLGLIPGQGTRSNMSPLRSNMLQIKSLRATTKA